MSKEEVLKALEEVKNSYAPITIDVTPDGEDNTQNRGKARKRILSEAQDANTEEQTEVDNNPSWNVGFAGSSRPFNLWRGRQITPCRIEVYNVKSCSFISASG